MAVTVKVKISDDDGVKFNMDHLIYEEFSVSQEDPLLKKIVADARSKVKVTGEPDIALNIKYQWQ